MGPGGGPQGPLNLSTPTGAEAAMRAGVEAGLEVCFANPGTTEMWFVGALDSQRGIRPVLGLHETVCTGACDGYGRMRGRPAAALLHLGPGLANGVANLHNARRARTPVVVLVGDMASWHRGADPLLAMDVEALARTVGSVRVSQGSISLPGEVVEAAARASEGGVATLVVPHDFSWGVARPSSGVPCAEGLSRVEIGTRKQPEACESLRNFVSDCASALKRCEHGAAAIYIGGCALREEGGALMTAGLIAAATGSALLCENAFSRLDRGPELPSPRRLPYFPNDAQAELAKYKVLVVVDARLPVAMFGYRNGPSQLMELDDESVWHFDDSNHITLALDLLAKEVGTDSVRPCVNCGGIFMHPRRPDMPKHGKLTAASMCAVIARLQPPDAIIVDESLTSGGSYWEASKGCPRFSHLTLTGGAIGSGPPMAVGAAIACPERPVINIQADGSCMYSLQALWTQARERLNVTTVICSNSMYGILKVELAKQMVPHSNGKGARRLTQLDDPALDWTSLAKGMGVPSSRADTTEAFAEQLATALDSAGPFLIEAVI